MRLEPRSRTAAPDGNGHPEVGALLAPHAYSDGTWASCSGTLVAPRVFVTAAHCEGAARVAVTFDTSYDAATGTTYWGNWFADPAYTKAQNDPHDLAVVVLDRAVTGITPARLPAAGSLAGLSGSQRFTSVGYGGQSVTNGPGGKTIHYADVRYVATGTLNAVDTELAADLPERVHRERRHLLRRLRRPELPRRRVGRDGHPRRDHDHGRLLVPLDERRLPARHTVCPRVPRAVRRASVSVVGEPGAQPGSPTASASGASAPCGSIAGICACMSSRGKHETEEREPAPTRNATW